MEGLQQRLTHASIEDKLRAIAEADAYGDDGLALLLPLLEHDSVRLAAAAYDVLREADSPDLQSQLVAHIPYEMFECLHKLPVQSSAKTHLFISPDSQKLIFVFEHGNIQVFDLHSGKQHSDLQGDWNVKETITAAALSPDGTIVYVGGSNGSFRAIALTTGRVVRSFPTQIPAFGSLSISQAGRILVASVAQGYGQCFELWDVQTGERLQTCQEAYPISNMYPTEEALVRNFLKGGARNGYQFSVEDVRRRVVFTEGGNHYYYQLGDRRATHDTEHAKPLPPLNMERPDIDVYQTGQLVRSMD
jgi:hypothetical protein